MKLSRYRLASVTLALALMVSALVGIAGGAAQAATFDPVAQSGEGGGDVPDIWADAPTKSGVDRYDFDFASPRSTARVESAGLVSDDFNACELNDALWTFTDPKNAGASYETNGTQLKITVPAGEDYNLWKNADFAARVTQPVQNAAFQVEAKFESPLTEQYQQQGIIIEDDSGKILRFEFFSDQHRPDPDSLPQTRVWVYAGVIDTGANPDTGFQVVKKQVFPSGDFYMRVKREFVDGQGFRWIQEYSFNGSNWTAAGTDNGQEFFNQIVPTRVGVYAGSTNTTGDPADIPGHTAIVDYFFTTDDPINPEDPKGYNVTTDVVGEGSINVTPNGAGPYACGDQVTFEAVGDPGWKFDAWSGDVTGSTTPVTAPFVMGMDVTGAFVQVATYTLDVTHSGQGSVSKNPDKAVYNEGEEVTLTATPADGWVFTGWTGDASGTSNPLTVTMDANKAIEANFVQTGFALNVQKVGNGSVAKNPDKTLYQSGEQVTLTATPDAGWSFSGWSGDATGANNPLTITMNSDKTVLATFTEDAYTLTVNTVGKGDVQVSPLKSTYKYGDKVTLLATPKAGWKFNDWSGDANGSDNPVQLTITKDATVAANFEQLISEVYLPLVQNGQ